MTPGSDLRVLIVDDNPVDRASYRRWMTRGARSRYVVIEADSGQTGLQAMERQLPDCVLLDYNLPDLDGLDFLAHLASRTYENSPAVVMLTGERSAEVAVAAMKRGAADYLVKNEIDGEMLQRTIQRSVENRRVRQEIDRARDRELAMKDELLSHVSHELRTPLAAAHQFTTLLLDGLAGELSEDQQEYMETISRNLSQLQSMIADLIESSRAQTGKLRMDPARIDLSAVASDAVDGLQSLAATNGVSLTLEAAEATPSCIADPHRVTQVITNLVGNALKFTDAGGSIELRISAGELDGFLRVSVKDSGCGMEPEVAARIFEHLYQLDQSDLVSRQGLGLGLYICSEIVRSHGGQITVRSEPGVGSEFQFTLPIFSMREALRRMIEHAPNDSESIALITVCLEEGASCSEACAEEAEREALELLQSCSLPDLDVLLPPFRGDRVARTLSIVACTGQVGADVMVRRISEQFERNELIRKTGMKPRIEVRLTELASLPVTPSMNALDVLAETLERTERETRAQRSEACLSSES